MKVTAPAALAGLALGAWLGQPFIVVGLGGGFRGWMVFGVLGALTGGLAGALWATKRAASGLGMAMKENAR